MTDAEKILAELGESVKRQTQATEALLGVLASAFGGGIPPGGTVVSPAGIRHSSLGQIVPAPGSDVTEDWLMLLFTANLAAGAPGVPGIMTVTIGSSGHFDLAKINHLATNNNFDMRIQSGDADKYLSNMGAWIPATCHSSAAQGLPYMIFGKRRFTARETITVEARDMSGAPNTVSIILHGIKVFV